MNEPETELTGRTADPTAVRRTDPVGGTVASLPVSRVIVPGNHLMTQLLGPRDELLDTIAPKKRIALLLYVIEGYSIEDVASLMGATQTATRSRVFFARRELRKRLSSDKRMAAHVAALLETGGSR